jgi:DNA-binding HxlR family transcriptional regulator
MDARTRAERDGSDGVAGCGLDDFLNFLAQRWMSHIVWTLAQHPAIRFGALRRALPGEISARVLSSRLMMRWTALLRLAAIVAGLEL